MNKTAFTLIELLAVIIILATIALIVTPIILGIINNANKEAFKSTSYGISQATKNAYVQMMYAGDEPKNIIYTYTDGVESSNPTGYSLNYSGAKPQQGQISLDDKGKIALKLYDGTYCATKGFDDVEITVEKKSWEACQNDDIPPVDDVPPVITLVGDSTVGVAQNSTYTEQGATASDNIDGDITVNITTTGTVNTSTLGSYTITYSVSDVANNTFQIERTVVVYAIITSLTYTGALQNYNVPITGSYKIEAWGAYSATIGTAAGGKGGYASGTITLTAGQVLNIYVGSSGSLTTTGWNGGGTNFDWGSGHGGGGGGGATDVRVNGTALKDRIIVAGGGGGPVYYNSSNCGIGGYGGGLTGGSSVTSVYSGLATGGTQTAGGAKGIYTQYSSFVGYNGQDGSFGQGGNANIDIGGGAGGGGYYGGGSGARNDYNGLSGGAGGSSFVSGFTGCNAVDTSGNHTGQPNHFSGLIFTGGQIISGNALMPNPTGGNETGHTGNGYLRITVIG